jgi:NhaA family Na+:H+ antiporter
VTFQRLDYLVSHSSLNQHHQSHPLTAADEHDTTGATASIALLLATVAALVCANTALADFYGEFLHLRVEFRFADFVLSKPLLLWINDGLMAVFFFLVGLEIKQELVHGSLSTPDRAVLPLAAALGGMVVPAGIYIFVAWNDAPALRGWAIPAATDIAFAIGILGLLGRRVPPTLKAFLLALAVIDDFGAIVIIALFYGGKLSLLSLTAAAVFTTALAIMNRLGVMRASAYVLVGIALWLCVLQSGVHATLAGVIAALFVPIRDARGDAGPLHAFERDLRAPVYFGIMPLFAFANAGVSLAGVSVEAFVTTISTAVALGLVLGKPLGVLAASAVYVSAGGGRLPAGTTWMHMLGAGCLAGIGFTMSLFIGTLAFDDFSTLNAVRFGVISGSIVSALAGIVVLLMARRAAI